MEDSEIYKKMIEDIFEISTKILESNAKKPKTISSHESKMNKDTIDEICMRKALNEIDAVREAFFEFQRSIHSLALFNFMDVGIEQFATYAVYLERVIRDDIDKEGLSPATMEEYNILKKLRAQIMSEMYNTYLRDAD